MRQGRKNWPCPAPAIRHPIRQIGPDRPRLGKWLGESWPPSDPWLSRQNVPLKLKGHEVGLDVAVGRICLRATTRRDRQIRLVPSRSSTASELVFPTRIRPAGRCSELSSSAMPWSGIASGWRSSTGRPGCQRDPSGSRPSRPNSPKPKALVASRQFDSPTAGPPAGDQPSAAPAPVGTGGSNGNRQPFRGLGVSGCSSPFSGLLNVLVRKHIQGDEHRGATANNGALTTPLWVPPVGTVMA